MPTWNGRHTAQFARFNARWTIKSIKQRRGHVSCGAQSGVSVRVVIVSEGDGVFGAGPFQTNFFFAAEAPKQKHQNSGRVGGSGGVGGLGGGVQGPPPPPARAPNTHHPPLPRSTTAYLTHVVPLSAIPGASGPPVPFSLSGHPQARQLGGQR